MKCRKQFGILALMVIVTICAIGTLGYKAWFLAPAEVRQIKVGMNRSEIRGRLGNANVYVTKWNSTEVWGYKYDWGDLYVGFHLEQEPSGIVFYRYKHGRYFHMILPSE